MEGEISTACTEASVGICYFSEEFATDCYFSEEFATDLFPVPGILTLALALALALTLTPGRRHCKTLKLAICHAGW